MAAAGYNRAQTNTAAGPESVVETSKGVFHLILLAADYNVSAAVGTRICDNRVGRVGLFILGAIDLFVVTSQPMQHIVGAF